MTANKWISLECLSNDHDSCLGRNCSTEQDQECECGCHGKRDEVPLENLPEKSAWRSRGFRWQDAYCRKNRQSAVMRHSILHMLTARAAMIPRSHAINNATTAGGTIIHAMMDLLRRFASSALRSVWDISRSDGSDISGFDAVAELSLASLYAIGRLSSIMSKSSEFRTVPQMQTDFC